MCDNLKKYANNDIIAQQQHWKRAQDYNKFFWDFFERVVGINMKDYHFKYMFSAMDCAKEELFENMVHIHNINNQYEYLIPKSRQDLYDILMEEVSKYDLPVRIGKHTYINWLSYAYYNIHKDPEYAFYHRNLALKFMSEQKVKYNLL
jgi:hypothetical protein